MKEKRSTGSMASEMYSPTTGKPADLAQIKAVIAAFERKNASP